MKKRVIVAALLAATVPMMARAQGADPDKKVEGGVSAKGWVGRTDKSAQPITGAKFVDMAGGFHVTSGPAAIYWNPANMAKGNFAVKATFTQTKAPTHPEAYGLFLGGTKLADDGQNYLYCIVRGDGKAMVKHRIGSDVHTLMDWTENAAVKKQDDAGKATNEVSLWASADKVGCSVNGTEVFSFPRASAVGEGKLESVDGLVGIRVNHNLDVHISGFGMAKM
ncbi:MAG: hypothetical protein U0163_14745 [Gemmatimonadaceae bacterium]